MNFNHIAVFVLILSLADLSATYFLVSTFHKKFPELDYTSMEGNPILRNAWKNFGLNWGMLIGGAVVFGLVNILVFSVEDRWQYFLCGMFSMMMLYHCLNYLQLTKL